jgi:hypothetical protein
MLRLRQLVLVAADRASVVHPLCDALGATVCFEDPSVKVFGLHNALLAAGDDFVEVVAPLPGHPTETAAGRHLARLGGDGGYMVIVQVGDVEAVKARAVAQGHKVIWDGAVEGPPSIRGVHLHPARLGSITSVDEAHPDAAWPWAGPDWEDHRIPGIEGIAGTTLAVSRPAEVLQAWADLLDRPSEGDRVVLDDGSYVRVVQAADGAADALVEIALRADDPAMVGRRLQVGSAVVRVVS